MFPFKGDSFSNYVTPIPLPKSVSWINVTIFILKGKLDPVESS